jgi:hypothetical protein
MTDHAAEHPETDPTASPAERRRRLTALAESPAWRDDLLPKLQDMLDDHITAATSQQLTPGQRAEHIEAIASMRRVLSLPQDMAASIAAARKLELTKGRSHQ